MDGSYVPWIVPCTAVQVGGWTLCVKYCSGGHKDQFGTPHAHVQGTPGTRDGPDAAVLGPGAMAVGSGPTWHEKCSSGGHKDQFDTPTCLCLEQFRDPGWSRCCWSWPWCHGGGQWSDLAWKMLLRRSQGSVWYTLMPVFKALQGLRMLLFLALVP